MIDGRTRVCGLIGNPVEHTLSPLIHNTLAGTEGRNLVYVPFPVLEDEVQKAVEGAFALQLLGLNVTVPYKSKVTDFLTDIDELAEKIGAVNTLVRGQQGYKGYNTDMLGLYRALCSEHIVLEGEAVLLLGAGGAARAVAYLCAWKKAAVVYVMNRTFEKAQMVADEVNQALSTDCVKPMAIEQFRTLPDRKYLAIQATSVGLHPDVDKAVVEEEDFYKKLHTAYDLIYNPAETKFMKLARAQGAKAYHGLKMLLYQGIIAYELWNAIEVPEETAQTVYKKMKEALGIRE